MKIAIITSGRLPVPATKGGAVETKLDYTLDYNAEHHVHDITVYSVKPDKPVDKNTAENHYIHYDMQTLWAKIGRKVYSWVNREPYYDNENEFFLWRCLRDIRRRHYDCIILLNRPGYILALKKVTQTPVVIQIDNDYLQPATRKAHDIKEAARLVITCSDYLSSRTSQVVCSTQTPVVTVHNGIDIGRFVHAKAADRSVLGLTKDDFVVFFSGRLTREKGIVELIRAVHGLHGIPRLRLIIAGASFYGKDRAATPFMREIKQEAEAIRDQVVFTGFIDYEQMPSYLKMADVIVVPSMWEEPFGLTVLEAMAAGVPLIATRCGGIPEICEGCAQLISRDDAEHHIAEAIQHVYDHPEEARAMARRAVERSWDFDKDAFSEKYLQALNIINT